MNILSFLSLLPFTEKPKPCVAWQPSEQAVCRPGAPATARPELCVCGTLMGSDTAASGPSPFHQPRERLPESQSTSSQPGAGQGKALLRCSWQGLLPYLAETLVVKETQSLENVSGVVPVISSHCAGEVPPVQTHTRESSFQTLSTHRLQKEHLCLHTLKESLDIIVSNS